MKLSDVQDVNWIKSFDKKPYGYGAVYIKEGDNVHYGTYRFKKHFLDDGHWIIMGVKDFTPEEWAEIPVSHRDTAIFKAAFNIKH